jgi:hypothetical protein
VVVSATSTAARAATYVPSTRGFEIRAHALEQLERRVRVGDEVLAIDPFPFDRRPRFGEEPQEARIVDRGDRGLAVIGRPDLLEATVGRQRGANDLRPLGDLVRRDRLADVGLVADIVTEMGRAVDDLHWRLLRSEA